MKAGVCWGGKLFKDKTFFPSTWTQEKVIQKATEVLQNMHILQHLMEQRGESRE